MNRAQFTATELLLLMNDALTSEQVAQQLHMASSTVRYHRNKMGKRVRTRKHYGSIRNLLTKEPHSTTVMTLPRKQVALMYDTSITTVKEARRVIRQQSN